MNFIRLKRFLPLATVILLAISMNCFAADHIDSPRVQGSEESLLDITDVFAFRSPTIPGNFVVIMGLFSPEGRGISTPLFSDNGYYDFLLDTNGDNDPDERIRVTFDTDRGTFNVSHAPGAATESFSGTITPNGSEPVVAINGNVKAFAGLADDPFVLDFVGFSNFVSGPCVPTAGLRCPGTGEPSNFFNGLNIATIALEFPIQEINGLSRSGSGTIRVWASTYERL